MSTAGVPFERRHPATQHLLRWLEPNPRLDGVAADVSRLCCQLAADLAVVLGDGPEFSAGLRKLLEAKDCFVRQGLDDVNLRLGTAAADLKLYS